MELRLDIGSNTTVILELALSKCMSTLTLMTDVSDSFG